MTTPSKKDKMSFPGIARSIVRPIVRTTSALVSRGEKVTGNVVRFATSTAKKTMSGTTTVASNLVKTSSKIVRDVSGSKRKTKATKKSRK